MFIKPVLWIGSSKKDLMNMPVDVVRDFGYGLFQAQLGEHPECAKILRGFGGAKIVELIQDHRGDTFRAVYTVQFADVLVVFHAFQKKSKRGIETPKQDLDLIRARLKVAEETYKQWKQLEVKSNEKI